MQNRSIVLWSDDPADRMVEYALMIALVAIGLIAILVVMPDRTGDEYQAASDSLQSAPASAYTPQ